MIFNFSELWNEQWQEHWIVIISVFVPLVHAIGIMHVMHAVMRVRTSQGAIAWSICLISFPYLAIPLYWIFGRNRFDSYVSTLNSAIKEHHAEVEQFILNLGQYRSSNITQDLSALSFEKLAQMPFTSGNSVDLLIDGEATFDAILSGIDQAKEYIVVQYYIVNDDQIGNLFKEHLIARSNSGIKVLFLYDEVGCHKLPDRYIDELKAAGIRVEPFKTTRKPSNKFQLNFRNHRKIVVVDGRIAFVGGLNVGDEYLGRSKKFGHWRDTHLRIEGPAVQTVQAAFTEDWYWSTRQLPGLDWVPTVSRKKEQDVLILATGPVGQLDVCVLFFLQAIQSASERIWITSPYFVPNESIMYELHLAALRGVKVKILLPDKADHFLVYLAGFTYLSEIHNENIKIYKYEKGFLHEKVMLIDNNLASIGTVNLDNRSLKLNFEISVIVKDRSFCAEVEKMLEADFLCSRKLARSEYESRSFVFRAVARAARLFAPIL